ncbi:hypothetical protein [Denitrobaculum tricleocarpae]|uniref:Uncharacterized protein n=1 Tax=Denitrobaculum tricleocarpae TaxID=2591009 RepID=A0A545TPY7_9PROT|nr:hypothetical protein [Denitrobaculum tricleocarpae]TQV79211.1 hypothetical protein FKG95_16250 [Denitrobaculum tricleocarpae]
MTGEWIDRLSRRGQITFRQPETGKNCSTGRALVLFFADRIDLDHGRQFSLPLRSRRCFTFVLEAALQAKVLQLQIILDRNRGSGVSWGELFGATP